MKQAAVVVAVYCLIGQSAAEVENAGKDCWNNCGGHGPCDWCGTGNCCRWEWDEGNGCDGTTGIQGKRHVCVAPVVVEDNDCVLSDWSDWDTCTSTCGGGSQGRSRSVLQYPADGGTCEDVSDSRTCNTHDCPLDCVQTIWSDWTGCTAECGRGNRARTRSILQMPAGTGQSCGVNFDSEYCNTHSCPNLENEGELCMAECGEEGACNWCGPLGYCCKHGSGDDPNGCDGNIGTPDMEHVCTMPNLLNAGGDCKAKCNHTAGLCDWCGNKGMCCKLGAVDGDCDGNMGIEGKREVCVAAPPSVTGDCVQSQWSEWSTCLNTEGEEALCGGGTHSRSRTTELEANGGDACGPTDVTEACNTQDCPPPSPDVAVDREGKDLEPIVEPTPEPEVVDQCQGKAKKQCKRMGDACKWTSNMCLSIAPAPVASPTPPPTLMPTNMLTNKPTEAVVVDPEPVATPAPEPEVVDQCSGKSKKLCKRVSNICKWSSNQCIGIAPAPEPSPTPVPTDKPADGGVVEEVEDDCLKTSDKKQCKGMKKCKWSGGKCKAAAAPAPTPAETPAVKKLSSKEQRKLKQRCQAKNTEMKEFAKLQCDNMEGCKWIVNTLSCTIDPALTGASSSGGSTGETTHRGDFKTWADFKKHVLDLVKNAADEEKQQICIHAAGKWQAGKKKCGVPKKIKCSKIKNMELCTAMGCSSKSSKKKCSGFPGFK